MYGIQPLSHAYRHILSLSESMLELAKRSEWDSLVKLEMEYLQAVAKTTELMPISEVDSAMQAELRRILAKILDNEAEIKRLLQARMDELSQIIGKTSRQQAVTHTYGQFSDNEGYLGDLL
ncbi:MAG: flagella biosynthesis regulatory protein FliT [Hafnia sp.]|uniref:flagella biosynthesis regulatory protein FliT n=1 Tax=Hafnia sp. TaxID=1873498 RepID=UPI002FCC283D